MKARFSALIILLANIGLLVHAAIPHYHGDDLIATVLHLVEDETEDEDAHDRQGCHHEGDHSHDKGHCQINDTLMASICRETDSEANFEADYYGEIAGLLPCLFAIAAPSSEVVTIFGDGPEIFYEKEPLLGSRGLRAPPIFN